MYEPKHQQFRLQWNAAPRPSVHLEPMRGVQTFETFDAAVGFMQKQPADATFVSLTQIDSYSFDRSAEALAALSNSERTDG